MKTKYKSKIAVAVMIAMLVAVTAACAFLFNAGAHNARAEQSYGWTTSTANGGTWEESEQGGETVYSYKATGDWNNFGYINNSVGFCENKAISLYVNYKDVIADGGDVNNNFVVRVIAENKDSAATGENVFTFLIMRGGAVTVRYNDTDIGNTGYTFPNGEDKWFKLSIVFNGESASMYIDDTEVLSVENPATQDVTLARTKMNISIWALPVSVKNITVTEKSGWDYSYDSYAYAYSVENGAEVFTHRRTNPDAIQADGSGEYNTFSADVRLNENFGAADGNIALSIRLNATDSYMFEYNPAPSRSYARLRYFDASHSVEGTELGKKDITIAQPSKWVNLKAVYERDYLIFYIDGVKVISVFDTGSVDFGNAQGAVSMWMVKGSVKNIAYQNTEKDYSGLSYVDLEFKKSLAAEVFDAQNGDISWEETRGALQLTVTGVNPSVTSPRIEVAEGSMYSMKLPVRNTFAVRLKNNTAADKLTLNYVTAVDETYDSVKQKTFDIVPNSDYTTYFFNISDVADCGHWQTNDKLKACKHFLRGFKFTFDGAMSGDIYIDAITFEREDRIYDYAATEFSALADKTDKTVTVSGKLQSKYAGQTVTVYETSVKNYNELLTYKDNVKIAQGKASANGEFTVEFPLERTNGMTYLSALFLAEVNGVKLNKSFMIENWRDFSENPYAFTLNALTVDVTDLRFGAKGDGFTNDNGAIQEAIDYVSRQGGGTVLIPGDTTSQYGRRYMITNLSLKSNVELRISEGAVLWQSSRLEDYNYGNGHSPVYGHDIYIEGTPWTHAAPCWNKPLIYASGVKNVRVTGGGEIRSMDTGTQWLDAEWGESELSVNCGSIIHAHSFASFDCENVEVTDITTKRGNIWHMPNACGKNYYFGNVRLTEISCINSDGISFMFGAGNAYVDRCTLYGNDDAIVVDAVYDDPRAHTEYSWYPWEADPEKFCGAENVTVKHCNVYGGHGLTLIAWGSNAPVEENAEIRDIYVTDNVIGGYTTAVGCWTDNPFYGESWIEGAGVAGTFTEREKDDYSAIKNLYIMNNIYDGACVMGTWPSGAPEYAKVTNAITDCGIYSASEFMNGSFDKRLKNAAEKTWESRLAYWSSDVEQNGEVGVEKVGIKLSPVRGTEDKIEINDYAGYVKGNGKLYQGLYNIFGKYEFSAKVKLVSGTAKLFVRDAVSGKTIVEKDISAGAEFQTVNIEYALDKCVTLLLGIEHSGGATELVYIDDAVLTYIKDPAMFAVQGVTYSYDFENNNGLVAYNPKGSPVSAQNGALTMPADAEYKVVLAQGGKLKEFDLSVDIVLTAGLKVDSGIYFAIGSVGYAADKIDAYNVQVSWKPEESNLLYIDLFEFSAENGYLGTLKGACVELPTGSAAPNKINLRVVVKSNVMFVFVNSDDDFVLMYELPDTYEGGNVGFRSQYALSRLENFQVKTAQFADMPGSRAELDKLLAVATKFAASAYTKESFAALTSAITAANNLTSASTQHEIDEVKKSLDWAIERLVESTSTPDDRPPKVEYVTQTVTEKDIGMTVGFYVVLGVLIAFIGAAAAIYFIKKNKNTSK